MGLDQYIIGIKESDTPEKVYVEVFGGKPGEEDDFKSTRDEDFYWRKNFTAHNFISEYFPSCTDARLGRLIDLKNSKDLIDYVQSRILALQAEQRLLGVAKAKDSTMFRFYEDEIETLNQIKAIFTEIIKSLDKKEYKNYLYAISY